MRVRFSSNPKTIRGVLFDLDGTLTLPGALDFPAIKREMGCPAEIPILEYIESRPEEERGRLYKILEKHEKKAARDSIPNEGAVKCLKILKTMGIQLGIITRNSLVSVNEVLRRFNGINREDFSVIITRENALPKPDPEGVLKAANAMGIKPHELLVVGDFLFDIMAGQAAGALTALIKNVHPDMDTSGWPRADMEIETLDELLNHIP